jgi:hypothetical protein
MGLAHSEASNPYWVPRKKIGELAHIRVKNDAYRGAVSNAAQ